MKEAVNNHDIICEMKTDNVFQCFTHLIEGRSNIVKGSLAGSEHTERLGDGDNVGQGSAMVNGRNTNHFVHFAFTAKVLDPVASKNAALRVA